MFAWREGSGQFFAASETRAPDRARRREYGLGAEGMVESDTGMIVLALDIVAFVGLGAFILLGLLIPLSAVWGEFLPQLGNFFDPEIVAAARITALQASLSAGISLVLGVLLALKLPRDSKIIRALLAVPFGIPAVAAATAWASCLPRAFSFGLGAVILAHVFFNVPWVALWVSRDLEEVSQPQQEAAATLGASPREIFRRVTLPAIAPTLASVFTQVFSVCAMSFILVMFLGGGPPIETLETTLYGKIRAEDWISAAPVSVPLGS